MKKVLSLILALVMALSMLSGVALADTAEEPKLTELASLLDELFSKEEKGEEANKQDLASLFGLLGELFSKEGEEETRATGEKGPVKVFLLDLLESLIDELAQIDLHELANTDSFGQFFLTLLDDFKQIDLADAIKADSIEQFFGNWNLISASIFGKELPIDEIFNTEKPIILTINEKGIIDIDTNMTLSNGILTFGGQDVAYIHLCEHGICFSVSGILGLDFAAAE